MESGYSVNIPRKVQKQLDRLPTNIQSRVVNALFDLGKDPRPAGSRSLKGREGYRLRVGDYRALYRVNDEDGEILVIRVGHRRDVYR
jgi:mRNA interferase RelE/StbE